MTHQSIGNEVTPDGIVHRCSCGWVSRPCFSNMIASLEGQEHRDAAGVAPTGEAQRLAMEACRLLCAAAVVQENPDKVVCPPAFVVAVRAAMLALRADGVGEVDRG